MITKYSLNGYNRKDTFSSTLKDSNKPNLVKKKKKKNPNSYSLGLQKLELGQWYHNREVYTQAVVLSGDTVLKER